MRAIEAISAMAEGLWFFALKGDNTHLSTGAETQSGGGSKCSVHPREKPVAGLKPATEIRSIPNAESQTLGEHHSYARLCLTLILVALRAGPIDASAPMTRMRINQMIAA